MCSGGGGRGRRVVLGQTGKVEVLTVGLCVSCDQLNQLQKSQKPSGHRHSWESDRRRLIESVVIVASHAAPPTPRSSQVVLILLFARERGGITDGI